MRFASRTLWRWLAPVAIVPVAALWSAWPWLAPRFWPAAGRRAVVVLAEDPRRTEEALDLWQMDTQAELVIHVAPSLQPFAWTQLIARHPGPPALARVSTLSCGRDTVGQLTCLADWMARRPQSRAIGSVTLVTSREHLPRAGAIAAIVLGSRRVSVQAWSAPTDAPPEDPWRQHRDRLRAQLWRLIGWDGRLPQP